MDMDYGKRLGNPRPVCVYDPFYTRLEVSRAREIDGQVYSDRRGWRKLEGFFRTLLDSQGLRGRPLLLGSGWPLDWLRKR